MPRQLHVPETEEFWTTPKFCTKCGDELHKPLRTKCNPCKKEDFKEYHRTWEKEHPRETRGAHLRTECKDCGASLREKDETYCSSCKSQRNKAFMAKKLAENTTCRDCGKERTGSSPYRCIDCQTEYVRQWRANRSPEKSEADRLSQRANDLFRKYGLTQEQFNTMWSEQDGKCAICDRELVLSMGRSDNKDGHAHVDHNHETGAIRGILCNHCNVGMGYFFDSKDFLLAAVDYIETHEGPGLE
jgi:hypothetical protein